MSGYKFRLGWVEIFQVPFTARVELGLSIDGSGWVTENGPMDKSGLINIACAVSSTRMN
jgi:hypothetical protein